jgi:hypothetical protein
MRATQRQYSASSALSGQNLNGASDFDKKNYNEGLKYTTRAQYHVDNRAKHATNQQPWYGCHPIVHGHLQV